MSKHRRDCVHICEEVGLDVARVEYRSRHLAVHTTKGFLIFPGTPSNHRWRANMRAQARRLARN
jgi:hypothetical protein